MVAQKYGQFGICQRIDFSLVQHVIFNKQNQQYCNFNCSMNTSTTIQSKTAPYCQTDGYKLRQESISVRRMIQKYVQISCTNLINKLIYFVIKNIEPHQKLMNTKAKSIQIIKDRLYWISDTQPPKNVAKSFYFNIDNDLEYEPFYQDFGPLSLGKTWKYVTQLNKLLKHPQYISNIIYHYTSTDFAKMANAAYLMGAFSIIILGFTADKAYQPFKDLKLVPFRDASYGECSYKCTLLDCLRGLDYAIKLGWFDYKKFNLKEYEHYEKVQNGDLNWIIPNKFVAFSSPYDKTVDKYGNKLFSPKDYVPIFKKLGVTLVVRLNNKTYEASGFTNNGIKHQQLFFTDGTAPSLQIVDQFLQLAENQKGAIAIHCKAGLGRTGSLIACYAMKHYHFNAPDFIGWIRIARPGSILGPQQHFLVEVDKLMKEKGKDSPIWKQVSETVLQKQTVSKLKNMSIKEVEMNERDKQVLANGDIGQGEYLVQAKLKSKKPSKLI